MVSRRNRTLLSLSVFLAVWAWTVSAAAVKGETGVNVGGLSNAQIEEQLQVRFRIPCDLGYGYAQRSRVAPSWAMQYGHRGVVYSASQAAYTRWY
jgi:hypothetical protein